MVVQLDLQAAHNLVAGPGKLRLDQLPRQVAQRDHAAHTPLVRRAQALLLHPLIPAVIHLAVLNGIGEVGHRGIGGNPIVVLGGFIHRAFHILPADVLDGLCQLLGQFRAGNGVAGGVVFISVHAPVECHRTQQHIGMLQKILVDRNAVFILPDVNPRGFDVDGLLPLLQEQDVRGDFRAGVGLERRVGQANRAEQLRALGDVSADRRILLVQRALAGDEGDDAARTHLVQRLGEEVVVDAEVVLVVSGVRQGIRAEGNVAHGGVKVAVREGRALKALHGDLRGGVQLLGDPAGDAVQLHAGQLAALHHLREHAEEVAHAAGRFQDVALAEAEV